MLSVAPVAPGEEVEVQVRWVAPLLHLGDRRQHRIPLTVGDVYGRSPLPDSDALLVGGPVDVADLSVRCGSGTVELLGGELRKGHARVPLNRPVDLVVRGGELAPLGGVAADGTGIELTIRPVPPGETPLDLAMLVDHSGSMDVGGRRATRRASKHEVVVAALSGLAPQLRAGDFVDLWEFDHQLDHVGQARGLPGSPEGVQESFRQLVALLRPPMGGTEVGAAVKGVLRRSAASDLLLITDGKSYEIDLHELARLGRRVSVLLIGEDSLEANFGHLAALTGGELFVVAGDDIEPAFHSAVASLRSVARPRVEVDESRGLFRALRGNATIEVRDRTKPHSADAGGLRSRAVAALAASLRLTLLPEDEAAALAEAEGLVTHLTSLVLVDEAGEIREGLPATRKIPLPTPDVAFAINECRVAPGMTPPSSERHSLRAHREERGISEPERGPSAWQWLLEYGGYIDWSRAPARLVAGDLSSLNEAIRYEIEVMATHEPIHKAADRTGIDPVVLVIWLISLHYEAGNRAAARIARTLRSRFPGVDASTLAVAV